MAKAIYGHLSSDARLAAEVVRLRARVRDLEAEAEALRAELAAAPPWPLEAWVVPDDLLVPDPL